ncbi:MAG: hypothetical protein ACLPLP_28150 [Mycobacterium sp.]
MAGLALLVGWVAVTALAAGLTAVLEDVLGYYLKKRSEGKSHNEAMRCLKRRLSDLVYRRLIHDAAKRKAGPAGHSGATLSSRGRLTPRTPALPTSHFAGLPH